MTGNHQPERRTGMSHTDLNTGEITALLAAAPLYRKSAVVMIRAAEPGERIVTALANGLEETAVTCKGGEPVITNPGGEQYVPIGGWAQVERRYVPLSGDRWQARGMIRAVRNPAGRDVTILAPWGEEQHGAPDCLFAAEYFPDDPERIGADRYLIGAAEFAETYSLVIPVTELYVRCSYPRRPDAIAASDTCQHPANTAVQDAEGNLWWRCPTHEGELTLGVSGEVVTHVPRATAGGLS
jgi:hypothetical protein